MRFPNLECPFNPLSIAFLRMSGPPYTVQYTFVFAGPSNERRGNPSELMQPPPEAKFKLLSFTLGAFMSITTDSLKATSRRPEHLSAPVPMLLVPAEAKNAAGHLFVDNIRFLSMAAVVLIHCIGGAAVLDGSDLSHSLLLGLVQACKFGTIGFFLISGYLMGEGLTRRDLGEYLKRRLLRVLAPWLFWFSSCFGIFLVGRAVHGMVDFHSLRGSAPLVVHVLEDCLFGTAYWFVPNLLLALCVLSLFRRFLYDVRMGCTLLAFSLFYGLNIYARWLPIEGHTEALFGFVFYLWLGAWAARNSAAMEAWIARISMPCLFAAVVFGGFVALRESEVLRIAGATDSMSTLRIGNQVYSVAVVLALLKLKKAIAPRIVDVRRSTFGIYLTHNIVLLVVFHVVKRTLFSAPGDEAWIGTWRFETCLSLAMFAVTYGCSLALTIWFLKAPWLSWTVGALPPCRNPLGINLPAGAQVSPARYGSGSVPSNPLRPMTSHHLLAACSSLWTALKRGPSTSQGFAHK